MTGRQATGSAQLEEARTGPSDGSLLRSFVGLWLRQIGGWVSAASAVELMADAGLSPGSTRTNLSRLKRKGLLLAEPVGGVPGYRLADEAHPMLARGDRRIYSYEQMHEDDEWMLVVFSVPESQRSLRHQLRSHLTWLGCGVVAPGAWIGPGHLLEETREVLGELGLLPYTTLFCTRRPVVSASLPDAVRQWWDLEALGGRYEQFLQAHEPTAERWRAAGRGDRQAFADHLRAVDDWRAIPYLDPGLPPSWLPPDWPGPRGTGLFAELHERLHEGALRHVVAVTGFVADGGDRVPPG